MFNFQSRRSSKSRQREKSMQNCASSSRRPKRSVSWKFPCKWCRVSRRWFYFSKANAVPLASGHDWHGPPGTRVCRPAPRRALLGWQVAEKGCASNGGNGDSSRVLQRCHPSHYFGINGGWFSLSSWRIHWFIGTIGQRKNELRDKE